MKLLAFILIQNQVGNSPNIIAELQRFGGIKSTNFVTGKYDVIAVAEVPNLTDLNPLISKIHNISGIGRTTTCLAIDNPAKAEAQSALRNVTEVSNSAIWAGRNYLGISVFQKTHILKWLARQSFVDASRIATCGLSLGSDPADIVGLLNPQLATRKVETDRAVTWFVSLR